MSKKDIEEIEVAERIYDKKTKKMKIKILDRRVIKSGNSYYVSMPILKGAKVVRMIIKSKNSKEFLIKLKILE